MKVNASVPCLCAFLPEVLCSGLSVLQDAPLHTAIGGTVECGDTVTFHCPQGFVMEGEPVLTCGPLGLFDRTLPKCRGK